MIIPAAMIALSAGTSSNYLPAVTFNNGSGVSFGLDGATVTASVKTDYAGTGFATTTALGGSLLLGTHNTTGLTLGVPAFLTTAMQSASSSVFARTGFATTTIAGAVVAGTHNTTGMTLAVPAYLTTAMVSAGGSNFVAATAAFAGTSASGTINSTGISVSIGPYITTAMASNRASDFVAASAAFAGTSASGTIASDGISVSIGPYITTGALSNHSHGVSFTSGSVAFQTLSFTNSNGISFNSGTQGIFGSHNAITTGALSNHSHGNPTLNLTNLSGTTASASDGFTLSLSAGAAGAVSFSGGTSSAALGSIVFSNSNGVSFGLNGSTMTASVNAGGAAATYSNFFQPFDLMGNSQTATSSGSLSQLHLMPFSVPVNLSFGQVNMIASVPVLNTGVVGTWSVRLTGTSTINYSAVYTLGNTNFIDCFLFSRGSGGYSSALETFASTRNSFITHQSMTFGGTVQRSAAGSTGSMSARQSCSMLISYPMITSGTMTSVNAASTFTTWATGYTTWNSTASTSVSNTYNTTTTGSTSIASTMVGTTVWSSYKMVPLHWGRSLTPGEYWLGMVRYSSTSSSSSSASTNAAPGTGASFTVTFNASALTRTQQISWVGQTTSLASSLGWLGFASAATMAPKQGHGSFSGTWASNTTYLNNGGNPAGAIAFSQINTGVSFFQSWIQMQSNGI